MRKLMFIAVTFAIVAVAITAVDAKKPTGKVKIAQKGLAMELEFPDKTKFMITYKSRSIPVDTYKPKFFTLMAQDKKKKIWKLESYTGDSMGPVKEFQITEGETTELDVGPPLVVKPVIYEAYVKNKQKIIPVTYRIEGKAGEVYRPDARVGAKLVDAPLFQITDEKGRVLAEGKFEYG